MIASKLFFSVFCVSVSGLITGCSFQYQRAPSQPFDPKNKVSKPFRELKPEHAVTFLVGLKPYLGKGTSEIKPASVLFLQSAGKSLLLKDSLGMEHKSVDINLSWRKVPLLIPKKLERQVVGPFSSFESAQRMAERLREKGISALIAHPKEWEVWISHGIEVPKEINVLPWTKSITSEIRPVLQKANGEILLSGPLKIEAPDGLYFNGGRYLGPFWLKADAYGSWTFIEEVPLPRYLQE